MAKRAGRSATFARFVSSRSLGVEQVSRSTDCNNSSGEDSSCDRPRRSTRTILRRGRNASCSLPDPFFWLLEKGVHKTCVFWKGSRSKALRGVATAVTDLPTTRERFYSDVRFVRKRHYTVRFQHSRAQVYFRLSRRLRDICFTTRDDSLTRVSTQSSPTLNFQISKMTPSWRRKQTLPTSARKFPAQSVQKKRWLHGTFRAEARRVRQSLLSLSPSLFENPFFWEQIS